jgi:hypothetical protein
VRNDYQGCLKHVLRWLQKDTKKNYLHHYRRWGLCSNVLGSSPLISLVVYKYAVKSMTLDEDVQERARKLAALSAKRTGGVYFVRFIFFTIFRFFIT